MNQSIKRSDLKKIYDSINESCTWRKRIQDTILWSDDSKIEVEDKDIVQGYNEANSDQKKLIEKHFKINTPKKIIDRVKNFDDILDIAGLTLEEVIPWKNTKTKKQESQNAFAKLQLIEEVLLEGYKFDWNNSSEYKYFPYFTFKARGEGLVYCSYHYSGSPDFAVAAYYKTSDLAEWAGKTFIKEYEEFQNRV